MDRNRERSVLYIVGPQVVNHYVIALLQQLDILRRHNKTTIKKLDLMTNRMTNLVTLVAKEKKEFRRNFLKNGLMVLSNCSNYWQKCQIWR